MGFETAARRHFDPIADRFGLACTATGPDSVEYCNAVSSFTISYERARGCDLAVDIGRPGRQRGYSLDSILRLRQSPDARQSRFAVADENKVEPFLAILAERLEQYGGDFLCGNAAAFEQLDRLCEAEVSAYALEVNLLQARRRAGAAWQAKDYLRVATELQPFESSLSPAEIARFHYAKKHAAC